MRRPSRVKVRASAKVNLSLRVGGLQADGFHPVETVYQAVDLFDDVVATRSEYLDLAVEGEGAEAAGNGPNNLAWRAAVALAEHAGVEPHVHLHLVKRIPIAGGMAGGSADAAGALVACDALWELETPREELLEIAASLGSDIPFSLVGGTQLGRGRGEQLTSVLARGDFNWVFAMSADGLSTPAVYREFDRLNPAAGAPVSDPELMLALATGDIDAAGAALVNDLQAAALSLNPKLKRVLAAGREAGAIAGIVSGSGPTCAFLARSHEQAMRLAVELQGSGVVSRTVLAAGPVRGAHIEAIEY